MPIRLYNIKNIKGVKEMNKRERNEKGFTMVELIIVVAIMGIIGALLVPSFGNMAAKSKVSTDVSTVKTIKRLIDAYNAEGNTPAMATSDTAATIGTNLFNAGYLESATINLQTKGGLEYTAATASSASTLKLDLTAATVTDANIKAVATKMVTADPANADWIKVS